MRNAVAGGPGDPMNTFNMGNWRTLGGGVLLAQWEESVTAI